MNKKPLITCTVDYGDLDELLKKVRSELFLSGDYELGDVIEAEVNRFACCYKDALEIIAKHCDISQLQVNPIS